MTTFTYRCPNTGFRVQGYAANILENYYTAVSCIMCGQAHLVDPGTGKLVGKDDEQVPKKSEVAALSNTH
jgi:hypothetical protein